MKQFANAFNVPRELRGEPLRRLCIPEQALVGVRMIPDRRSCAVERNEFQGSTA